MTLDLVDIHLTLTYTKITKELCNMFTNCPYHETGCSSLTVPYYSFTHDMFFSHAGHGYGATSSYQTKNPCNGITPKKDVP